MKQRVKQKEGVKERRKQKTKDLSFQQAIPPSLI